MKFNLPMAWSTAVLAWSVVDFTAGYKAAGQYKIALDNIKWVTDYFIKCIGDGSDVVVQVGVSCCAALHREIHISETGYFCVTYVCQHSQADVGLLRRVSLAPW